MLPLHELSTYHDHRSPRDRAHEYAYIEACVRYQRMRRRAGLLRLWALLTGAPWALRRLADLGSLARSGARKLDAVQEVPLNLIVGSDNRFRDFDRTFAPLGDHSRERWIGVALARAQSRALPPVELVRVDGAYYVVDGHHRISVARAYGEETIEANVLVHLEVEHAPAVCCDPIPA